MQKKDLQAARLPDTPGVYFFRGSRNEVLYVGKATSLRDRVRSYFSNDLLATRGPRLVDMVTSAKTVTYEETDSVLEALILESHYIKKYHPKANSDGKDDKSYTFVVFTKEEVPRVLFVRGKELDLKFPKGSYLYLFGPFPHGGQLKEALKIVRKIFPYFDTRQPIGARSKHTKGSIEFNQQIGLFPDVSTKSGLASYKRTIHHLKLFFQGKKKQLLRELENEMHAFASHEEFEKANERKRQLFALQHIRDVALIKEEHRAPNGSQVRIEAYDIAHTSGKAMVGVMTVVEDGQVQKGEYRKFTIRSVSQANDTAALSETLERRLGHNEWPYPKLIVIDGGKAQLRVAQDVLNMHGFRIPVVSVVKDEKHRPREILGLKEHKEKYNNEILLANSEAHRFAISWHRKKRNSLLK